MGSCTSKICTKAENNSISCQERNETFEYAKKIADDYFQGSITGKHLDVLNYFNSSNKLRTHIDDLPLLFRTENGFDLLRILKENITEFTLAKITANKIMPSQLQLFEEDYHKVWHPDVMSLMVYFPLLSHIDKIDMIEEKSYLLSEKLLREIEYNDQFIPYLPQGAEAFVAKYPDKALIIAKGLIKELPNGHYNVDYDCIRKTRAENMLEWYPDLYKQAVSSVLSDIENGRYKLDTYTFTKVNDNFKAEQKAAAIAKQQNLGYYYQHQVFDDYTAICTALAKKQEIVRPRVRSNVAEAYTKQNAFTNGK